jgi:hypothetical protein
MKRALDYISRDASEAVYVYDTPGDVTTQLDDLPTGTPILAFWRLDPVDISDIPATCSGTTKNECEALKIRHNTYTLVVYLQETNAPGDIWEGPSRIIRYELPKYSRLSDLTQTPGYVDPTLPHPAADTDDTYEPHGFTTWFSAKSENTRGSSAVLTDFVDGDTTGTTTCPTADYTRTPATSDSFFACVRSGEITVDAVTSRTNQSLVLFLTGNADNGNTAALGLASDSSRTPTLESEVFIRGVLEKAPD